MINLYVLYMDGLIHLIDVKRYTNIHASFVDNTDNSTLA
jgi:hypothetical protein